MNWLIYTLIIFALSVHVLPSGINLNVGMDRLKAFVATVIVALLQVLMFGVGKLLGSSFLHLIGGWGKGVVFVVFFLISVRMVMEAFKIRKGEIHQSLDNPKLMALTGLAQGIDAFLVGMMFYYFPEVKFQAGMIGLFLLSTFMILPAIFTVKTKTSLSFVSLMYIIGSLIFGVLAVYFLINI